MPASTEITTNVQPAVRRSSMKRHLQGIVFMLVWIAVAFACAGTLNWWRGWFASLTLFITMQVMGIIVNRRNPELFPAREKWRRKDTKPFDKVFIALQFPLSLAQPVAAGLDVRFHRSWSNPWTLFPATGLYLLAMVMIGWTMAVNRWAETTVRIQSDRGQQVVRSGPYRWVRHPMYLGCLAMYPGTAWMLGSPTALMLAVLHDLTFVVRTALEDRTLQRELPGYRDYAAETRWRLLPGIW